MAGWRGSSPRLVSGSRGFISYQDRRGLSSLRRRAPQRGTASRKPYEHHYAGPCLQESEPPLKNEVSISRWPSLGALIIRILRLGELHQGTLKLTPSKGVQSIMAGSLLPPTWRSGVLMTGSINLVITHFCGP